MKPLAEMVPTWGENISSAHIQYLSFRCMGLFDMMKAMAIQMASEDDDSELLAETNEFIDASRKEVFLRGFTVYRFANPSGTVEEFQTIVMRAVPPIVENYQALADKEYLLNGGIYLDNELIAEDLSLCRSFIESTSA